MRGELARSAAPRGRVNVGWALLVGLLVASSACKKLDAETPGDKKTRERTGHSPMSMAELPTLDAKAAFARMEEDITREEAALGRGEMLPALYRLANLFLVRGYQLGKVTDLERAVDLGTQAINLYPDDPQGYLELAQAQAELQRFPEAEALLKQAEQRGVKSDAVQGTRTRILRALARNQEAVDLLVRHNEDAPDLFGLASEAVARGGLGQIDRAAELFIRAQHFRQDSSPLALAWLYYQEGLFWTRQGRNDRAMVLFEAALERVPQYARAAAALGPLLAQAGRRDEAVAVLRRIAESAEDPECAGLLAGVLEGLGKVEDSERWRTIAESRYTTLLADHPEAFALRAARFWLQVAKSPEKALAPAQKAIDVYNSAEAYALALEAAVEAGDKRAACDLASRRKAAGVKSTPDLDAATARAEAACAPAPQDAKDPKDPKDPKDTPKR